MELAAAREWTCKIAVYTGALTKREWMQEVSDAIAAGGLHFTVFAAVVEVTSPMCRAEVTDVRSHKILVSLARDRFPTPAKRREEILRQLRDHAWTR